MFDCQNLLFYSAPTYEWLDAVNNAGRHLVYFVKYEK
jgi:hypothetical protein